MTRRGMLWLGVGLVIVVPVAMLLWMARLHQAPAAPPVDSRPQATFLGSKACVDCHRDQADRWRTSMHARAMMAPSADSIAAPFHGEQFTNGSVKTSFSRRDASFTVRTDGPDGAARDFDVKYTFGVFPLQQYLLELPRGRLQALSVAWDARPSPAGQHWFHLYPAATKPDDVQHWTSRSQNWNMMCADCHSTNLRKHYDATSDTYRTTWTDLNVACEACHGPGSNHLLWAKTRQANEPRAAGEDTGLVRLDARDNAGWTFDPSTGIAHRSAPRSSHIEVQVCARCHARRSQLTDETRAGQPLADAFRPALLDEDLYFADGQIQDEVYEYGSFLQSKMYANGVTCSDCHDPHKPEISSDPNDVCQRCHLATVFAKTSHHHHAEGSPGSRCVSCHMPTRTYMTIDDRRDHSFRVPRPDLTVSIGTPNACASCHSRQPASWAAAQVASWMNAATGRGSSKPLLPHYGEALAAGRTMAADAEPRLLSVIGDAATPAIVRATAISLLHRWLDPRSAPVVIDALRDPDPLVRLAAIDVIANLPAADRAPLLVPLLDDGIRSVRIAAARAVADVPDQALSAAERDRRGRALSEWERVQEFNADTAGARVNLGAYYAERGDVARAKEQYEAARRLEPYFAPAAINFADLYRAQGDDASGERVLREAIARTPSVAALHHSLGLLLARRQDVSDAVAELKRAADLAPDDVDVHYALGVALYSAGRRFEAIAELDRTWRRHPGDRTTLIGLISYVREQGDAARAESLAVNLVQISPDDPRAKSLLEEIRRKRQ